MKAREDLRELANSIIDSYEMRVSTVSTLMNQAYHFLNSFQTEFEDMIIRVRDNLAKAESLRKKDFDRMISDIIEGRRVNKEEARQGLKLFQEQEEEMITRLRKIILNGKGSSVEDINVIKDDISGRQKEREKSIIKALKCFQIEQEELMTALKNLLSKGEEVKLKDFRIMLKSLGAQQGDRDEDLIKMLDEFEVVRDKVQTQWQTVARVSN
jgi:translation initiation factor 1 (eIF-1/SUI1)